MDETLVADGIRTCHVINEDRTVLRYGIDVDDGLTALAVYAHVSRSIYRAVEGVIAKFPDVISQEVLCLQVEVVAQLGEVLMMDATVCHGNVVVAVVDGIVYQQDVVRDGMSTESVKVIFGAQLLHVHLTAYFYVAHEVDFLQVAHYVHLSVTLCLKMIHETATEVLHEFHIGSGGLNTEVDIVALRRYITVDVGLSSRSFISSSPDVYLFVFLVEVFEGMENAHRSVLEGEVLDVQLGVGIRILEDRFHDSLSCRFSCEIHRVEVDEVEDVCHIYVLQVSHDGILLVRSSHTIDDDVLFAVFHYEIIHGEVVFVVFHGRCLHIPLRISQHQTGRFHAGLYGQLSLFIL